MRIEVNKECVINQDNIAKCRDRDIAVSVTCKDVAEDNGFINYTLAINDDSQCCEEFGVELIMFSDETYISYIEHECDDDKIYDIAESKIREEYGNYWRLDEELGFIASAIYGKNDKLIAVAVCYNMHNGYYSHKVYADINGETHYNCI